MLSSNQDSDFNNGYTAALEEVLRKLTENPWGRTEAYEEAVEFIRAELNL